MQTIKIVVNRCFGGYSLSEKAYEKLGLDWDGYGTAYENDRTNPELVRVVEELGNRASGECAKLEVQTFEVSYQLNDYDGRETATIDACEID